MYVAHPFASLLLCGSSLFRRFVGLFFEVEAVEEAVGEGGYEDGGDADEYDAGE